MDVALDIETMGTTAKAVVLTIGAVRFDPHGPLLRAWSVRETMLLGSNSFSDHERLHVRLDVGQQVSAGHAIDVDTLAWWADQDDLAFAAAFGDGIAVPIRTALLWLTDFCRGAERFWAQGGLTFDFPILETLYECAGLNVPWHYNEVRDVRTLVDGHGASSYGIKHHALWDAFNEARWVQERYRARLPWWKRFGSNHD